MALANAIRLNAMKTQRLARSSFSPELRFALLKGATNIIPRVATVNAISAGWLKNAVHPPIRSLQARIALFRR